MVGNPYCSRIFSTEQACLFPSVSLFVYERERERFASPLGGEVKVQFDNSHAYGLEI